MGFRRQKVNPVENITLFNDKALPGSLKDARLYMSISLPVCVKTLYGQL